MIIILVVLLDPEAGGLQHTAAAGQVILLQC